MDVTAPMILGPIAFVVFVLPVPLFIWFCWYNGRTQRSKRQYRAAERARPHFDKMLLSRGFTIKPVKSHLVSSKVEYERKEENGDSLIAVYEGKPIINTAKISFSVQRVSRNGHDYSEHGLWRPFDMFGRFKTSYVTGPLSRATRRKYSKMPRGARNR